MWVIFKGLVIGGLLRGVTMLQKNGHLGRAGDDRLGVCVGDGVLSDRLVSVGGACCFLHRDDRIWGLARTYYIYRARNGADDEAQGDVLGERCRGGEGEFCSGARGVVVKLRLRDTEGISDVGDALWTGVDGDGQPRLRPVEDVGDECVGWQKGQLGDAWKPLRHSSSSSWFVLSEPVFLPRRASRERYALRCRW